MSTNGSQRPRRPEAVARAPQHARVLIAPLAEAPRECRFPDSGLAPDKHEPTPSGERIREPLVELLDARVSLQQAAATACCDSLACESHCDQMVLEAERTIKPRRPR